MLEGKAPGQDGRVAGNRGNRPELLHRRVVDAEEETVLDGMVVCDLPSGAPPRLGPAAAAVEGDGGRHVEAAPARPPQPQRQVRVLAVKKEILVEPPGRDPDGVERGSPVKRRGPGSAGDLALRRRRGIGSTAVPVEVAPRRGE